MKNTYYKIPKLRKDGSGDFENRRKNRTLMMKKNKEDNSSNSLQVQEYSKTSSFQILCVTMHQDGFENVKRMNIHSDVIFSNQDERIEYAEKTFDGFVAKMITTNTKGVGKNRNISLLYADARYCLFADDDVRYLDNVDEIVLSEFKKYPQADIFIFHFKSTDAIRTIRSYNKTRQKYLIEPMPWATFQIAFRLSAVKKANIWFSTLFGGGCEFPSGEDSIWLKEAENKGLKIFVSNKTIGEVSFAKSSWFNGFNEEYYRGRGALYQVLHPKMFFLYMFYMCVRSRNFDKISPFKKIKYMLQGRKSFLAYEC